MSVTFQDHQIDDDFSDGEDVFISLSRTKVCEVSDEKMLNGLGGGKQPKTKKKSKAKNKQSLNDFLNDQATGTVVQDSLPTAPAAREDEGDSSESWSRRKNVDSESRQFQPSNTEIPKYPPFRAYVGNLNFETTPGDVEEFFHGLKVKSVNILKDRETERSKGFGYVEFSDADSLSKAIKLCNSPLNGRSVKVDVATPSSTSSSTSGHDDKMNLSTWRRTTNLPVTAEKPKTNERYGTTYNRFSTLSSKADEEKSWRKPTTTESSQPESRPRLNLQPRKTTASVNEAVTYQKPNPFGGAKPVDTQAKLMKFEK